MKKTIYTRTNPHADALIFYDKNGKQLDISGMDMDIAKQTNGGLDKLFKTRIVSHFSEEGLQIEIRNSDDKAIWSEKEELESS